MDQTFQFQGKYVSYNDIGTGQAIILIHGYLESKEIWDSFAEKLSSDYRVICIDLPGHGTSDVYGESHSMEFMASCIKLLADHLGIERFFLAGHSLGGYVTLAFLELYPGSLSGYCLFHSQPFADPEPALEKRRREKAVVRSGKKNLMYPDNVEKMYAKINLEKFQGSLRRSKEIASRIPGDGIIAMLNGMMERPSRQRLMEEGKVPCLWILGAMDNYIPVETISSRVSLPENAELVVLQNSGHLGFIEEEEHSLEIFRNFIVENTL